MLVISLSIFGVIGWTLFLSTYLNKPLIKKKLINKLTNQKATIVDISDSIYLDAQNN
jgi:hypothetical protein